MRTTPFVRLVFGLIAAAGSSKRFGGGVSKPLLNLGDKTVLEKTLTAFAASKSVARVVILVKEEDLAKIRALRLETLLQEKPFDLVIGGATREESVYQGLSHIRQLVPSPQEAFVAIHDAARCFLETKLLDDAIAGAFEYNAVTTAIPVVDSLKRVSDSVIVERVPRENLWAVQTPQVFRLSLILAAHEKARSEGKMGCSTDDAALVEPLQAVHIIQGRTRNFKITTSEDFELARGINRVELAKPSN